MSSFDLFILFYVFLGAVLIVRTALILFEFSSTETKMEAMKSEETKASFKSFIYFSLVLFFWPITVALMMFALHTMTKDE